MDDKSFLYTLPAEIHYNGGSITRSINHGIPLPGEMGDDGVVRFEGGQGVIGFRDPRLNVRYVEHNLPHRSPITVDFSPLTSTVDLLLAIFSV